MKMVKAVIREERFDFVKKALENRGFFGMTTYEVMGRGEQRGVRLPYRSGLMAVDLLPKVCIEIVIKDNDVEVVLETIEKAAKTGKIGDGRVFVMPVDISLRVRTGERESL